MSKYFSSSSARSEATDNGSRAKETQSTEVTTPKSLGSSSSNGTMMSHEGGVSEKGCRERDAYDMGSMPGLVMR